MSIARIMILLSKYDELELELFESIELEELELLVLLLLGEEPLELVERLDDDIESLEDEEDVLDELLELVELDWLLELEVWSYELLSEVYARLEELDEKLEDVECFILDELKLLESEELDEKLPTSKAHSPPINTNSVSVFSVYVTNSPEIIVDIFIFENLFVFDVQIINGLSFVPITKLYCEEIELREAFPTRDEVPSNAHFNPSQYL